MVIKKQHIRNEFGMASNLSQNNITNPHQVMRCSITLFLSWVLCTKTTNARKYPTRLSSNWKSNTIKKRNRHSELSGIHFDCGVVRAPSALPCLRISHDLHSSFTLLCVRLAHALDKDPDLIIGIWNTFIVNRNTVFLNAAFKWQIAQSKLFIAYVQWQIDTFFL